MLSWTRKMAFTADDQEYMIRRYVEGEGPKDLAQTIELAKQMTTFLRKTTLLTFNDAVAIIRSPKLSEAFSDRLGQGDWAYVRTPKAASRPFTPICLVRSYSGMLFGEYRSSDSTSTVVILKESNKASRAAELAPVARR